MLRFELSHVIFFEFDIFDCSSLKIGKKLGEGANAEVYRVIYNDKPYAIKIYKYPKTYFISRVKQDFFSGNSFLGLMTFWGVVSKSV